MMREAADKDNVFVEAADWEEERACDLRAMVAKRGGCGRRRRSSSARDEVFDGGLMIKVMALRFKRLFGGYGVTECSGDEGPYLQASMTREQAKLSWLGFASGWWRRDSDGRFRPGDNAPE